MKLRVILLVTVVAIVATVPVVRSEDGPAVQRLTYPRFSYPSWSPDGARILFESNVTGNWEIWMMDLEGLQDGGGHLTRLTDNQNLDRMPSFSKDGRFIAFISDRDGDYEVFRMNRDGSNPVQLTFDEVPEIHPYWSADGTKIVYNRKVDGKRLYEIRMINPDGSGDTSVLKDGELNSYAQMSPDGRLVVFDKWVDNDENNGEIFVLELESGRLTRLTDNHQYDGYPAWFPDGQRIIYASEIGETFKLFSIRPDGTDRRQLTFGPGNDMRANVSRDGKRIVFNREIDDNVNILVMPVEAEPDKVAH